MSTRRLPRAAGWSRACWAPSTVSNPLIVLGLSVQAVRGFVYESLLARGYNEPFTLYGLLARGVETDDARDYVTFSIDPRLASPTGYR